jgi:hypothetical protein
MWGRSEKDVEYWRAQVQHLSDRVKQLQKANGVNLAESADLKDYLENIAPSHVLQVIEIATPILFAMSPMVLKTDDELGFITSDSPCIVYNPKYHRLPPSQRSPGLRQADIGITLPLTPHHLLLYRHDTPAAMQLPAGRRAVDEANSAQVWFAGKEIVSWKGMTRSEWFEKRNPPPDAWENTPEGKAALKKLVEH